MGVIPKHEDGQKPKKGKRQSAKSVPERPNTVVLTGPDSWVSPTPSAMQHEVNYVAGLEDVPESLDFIARMLCRLTSDEHATTLSLGQGSHTSPVKLTLAENDYDDTMDRFVTALQRIADSVSKLAGLSRPRLESWHEQDEYEPRYKDIAVDGGAPGPKTDGKTL
jgi:hypothetical protein